MENKAGFGPRLLALLIDFAVMWILAALFYIAIPQLVQPYVDYQMSLSEESLSQVPFDSTPIFFMINFLILARLLIFSTEIAFGTSLGKYLLKLKITNREGEKPSVPQLLSRYAVKHIYPLLNLFSVVLYLDWIGNISLGLGVIVFIGCFFALGENKLTLQDVLSRTMVISLKKPKESTSAWISEQESAKEQV